MAHERGFTNRQKYAIMCMLPLLNEPNRRREGVLVVMEYITNFVLSVAASILANGICIWLDRHSK